MFQEFKWQTASVLKLPYLDILSTDIYHHASHVPLQFHCHMTNYQDRHAMYTLTSNVHEFETKHHVHFIRSSVSVPELTSVQCVCTHA